MSTEQDELEKALKLVEQHRKERIEQFQIDLDALCEKYGVVLGTSPAHITVRLADG